MPKRYWSQAISLAVSGLFGMPLMAQRSSSFQADYLAFQSPMLIRERRLSDRALENLRGAYHRTGGSGGGGGGGSQPLCRINGRSRSSTCSAECGGCGCGPLMAVPQQPRSKRRVYPSWGQGNRVGAGTSPSHPLYYRQQQSSPQQQQQSSTIISSAGWTGSSSPSKENAQVFNESNGGVNSGEGGLEADAVAAAKKQRAERRRFNGVLASAFQHPYDQEATAMLRRLPGLELAIRSAVPAIEDAVYMDNIANSILVGPNQMASLHSLMVEACRILDMPQVPDMYIRQNPVPNAYTLAIRGKKPFIVLHTSLLDLMEPEEVQAVIAHELGHLKCEHGIWVTLATVLANGLYRGGFVGAFLADRLGLRRSLMRWSRAAEFTCDRAAMLVAQDVNIVVSTLLKLAGGSISQASELSVTEFLKQASAYDLASKTRIGRLLKNSQSEDLTHPLPVIRARELVKFSKSSQYLGLLRRGAPL